LKFGRTGAACSQVRSASTPIEIFVDNPAIEIAPPTLKGRRRTTSKSTACNESTSPMR
jgi:hypothetical protein